MCRRGPLLGEPKVRVRYRRAAGRVIAGDKVEERRGPAPTPNRTLDRSEVQALISTAAVPLARQTEDSGDRHRNARHRMAVQMSLEPGGEFHDIAWVVRARIVAHGSQSRPYPSPLPARPLPLQHRILFSAFGGRGKFGGPLELQGSGPVSSAVLVEPDTGDPSHINIDCVLPSAPSAECNVVEDVQVAPHRPEAAAPDPGR